ncbi:MAG: hypothetical protein ACRYHQ_07480 [Janthinobacterium lividum]
MAVQALAGSGTVSGLAARHGVSRKFVYQQTHKARAVLDDAFPPATPDDEVLFELAVTKAWLRQAVVGLTLICLSSYRGAVEFLRDLLGVAVSLGCVHDVLQAATRQASAINRDQDRECQKHGALRRELECWVTEASVQHRGPDLKHTMSAAG